MLFALALRWLDNRVLALGCLFGYLLVALDLWFTLVVLWTVVGLVVFTG